MTNKGKWQNRIIGYGEEAPDQLLANPKNFRVHPKGQQDALLGVIRQVGIVDDVLVSRNSGCVIDGHLRVALAISENQPTIPVKYLDLTEEEEALILATFDPLSAMATADKEQLDALLREVSTGDAAVQAMLADLAKGAGLYLDKPKDDPGAQIDKAEELRKKWGTATGQLWQVGKHRLLCGDSTKAEDVARLMGGEKAEMLWSDPPYGVEYTGKTKDALKIQNDGADGLMPLLVESFKNATAGCAGRAPWYIAHPAGALCLVFGDAIRAVGWQFHQTLIWVKDSMVLGHSDYHFKHEPMYYGFMPGEGRPGRGNHEGSKWHGDHAQVSVFEIARPKRSEEHPTMKPPELIAKCITNSSGAEEIVLDIFLGSGTTLVAAEQTGRICYGMEISEKYVAVALERMAGMGLEPRFING